MSESLQKFPCYVGEEIRLGHDEAARSRESLRGRSPAGLDNVPALSFNSNEAAARYSSLRQRLHDSPVLPPALS
jgi:hypothetical protein